MNLDLRVYCSWLSCCESGQASPPSRSAAFALVTSSAVTGQQRWRGGAELVGGNAGGDAYLLVMVIDADDLSFAGDFERTIRVPVGELHLEADGRAETELGRSIQKRGVDTGDADVLGVPGGLVEHHGKYDAKTRLLTSIRVRERVQLHRQNLQKGGRAHHPARDGFFSNWTFYGDLRCGKLRRGDLGGRMRGPAFEYCPRSWMENDLIDSRSSAGQTREAPRDADAY